MDGLVVSITIGAIPPASSVDRLATVPRETCAFNYAFDALFNFIVY